MTAGARKLRKELQKLQKEFDKEPIPYDGSWLHTRFLHRRIGTGGVRSVDLTHSVMYATEKNAPIIFNMIGVVSFVFDSIKGPSLVVTQQCWRHHYSWVWKTWRDRKGKVHVKDVRACQRPITIEELSEEHIAELLAVIAAWWKTPHANAAHRRKVAKIYIE